MLQQMNNGRNVMENKDTVVFCFGRMQPVTLGHERMIRKVVSEAKNKNADHVVFLSQTQKLPNNPLDWNYKRNVAKSCFPGVHISEDTSIKTPYQALEKLTESYKNIVFVCGEDRIEHFSSMSDYATQWGTKSFVTESAGSRNSDLNSVKGVSGSRAREAVINNDFESFYHYMPTRMSRKQATDLFQKMQSELGMEESPEELNKEADEYRQGSLRGEFIYTGWG